jgi:hypothetical protein
MRLGTKSRAEQREALRVWNAGPEGPANGERRTAHRIVSTLASHPGWRTVDAVGVRRAVGELVPPRARPGPAQLNRHKEVEQPAHRRASGVAHSRQNFAWGGFSCWHRGHFMPSLQ